MTTTKTVEFVFDVGSPTTYLAWTQLPKIAKRNDATVTYTPVLLGGIFKATGNASPVTVKAKGRWMLDDLRLWAKKYKVPFEMNPHFPINTLPLMRGAAACREDGTLDAYLKAVFQAIWVDGKDMGSPEVISEVLAEGGLDADHVLARVQEDAVKQKLIANTEAAVERGVFGCPTFFVGERMFFGQDRLTFVEDALSD